MQKLLSQLLPSFTHVALAADGKTLMDKNDISNIPISSIVFDSRAVKEGSLFFALPGIHSNGNSFIADAIRNGANAVVYQDEIPNDIQIECAKLIAERGLKNLTEKNASYALPAFLKVRDARFSMAPVSDAFYDSPSKRLIVIGVTGTEGKSSTVSFIWQLLRLLGERVGFVSTVEYSHGGDAIKNPEHQTTPEAPLIQEHLNAMLENGCTYAVLESSSHGLSTRTNRLGLVQFDCAVFMNVTHEHLEFHKTFEQYRSDKANLFRVLDQSEHIKTIAGETVKINSIGVVNLEDPSALYFINSTKHPVYGFTTEGLAGKSLAETGEAATPLPAIPDGIRYMCARNIASARFGLSFSIDAFGEDAVFKNTDDPSLPVKHPLIHITSSLPGTFNAYNIMAAIIAVSSVTKKSFEEVSSFVAKLIPVHGRMTVVDEGQPFEVIIDYAHTPSSFETIFPSIRKRCSGRLISLFGSGGERDVQKRAQQGEIASRYSDVLYFTDEDPRFEDSMQILQMIAEGAQKNGKRENIEYFLIPSRPNAIREAFKNAKAGDIVLLLGKAHENSIIYKDVATPYDELTEAKRALSEMGFQKDATDF
ncbi:MAG: UDP-N-acetylmuramyl-tripeptide synthetase [Treponema sp.]|nr:UDP-N-acetylmuramyl-tripeptide synthetase [Treponema sp.]